MSTTIENSVLTIYLKLADLIKHVFIFGNDNLDNLINQFHSLDYYSNLHIFSQENNEFFKTLSNYYKEKDFGHILLLNSNVNFYSLAYENLVYFINNFDRNTFDIVIFGAEFENNDFSNLKRYENKILNLHNLSKLNNIYSYIYDKSIKINKVNAILVSSNFAKQIDDCSSMLDVINKANNIFIIKPFLFEKKTNINYFNIIKRNKHYPVYKFKQDEHFGDTLFTLIFLNFLIKRYPYLNIEFYISNNNLKQIKLLSESSNLIIKSILFSDVKDIPYIGFGFDNEYYSALKKSKHDLNLFKQIYYKRYAEKLFNLKNLNVDFEVSIEDGFYTNSNIKFKDTNYEYFIINSKSFAGVFYYAHSQVQQKFEQIADFLAQHNKSFITTEPIKDYPCTRKLYSNLIDIYSISHTFKYIIGMNTSPILVSITKENYKNLKKIYYLNENGLHYNLTLPNSQLINNVNDFINFDLNLLL